MAERVKRSDGLYDDPYDLDQIDEEACELCGDPDCYGIVQHQMTAVIGAYVIAHRRGDHATIRPSLCRLCALDFDDQGER